MPNTTILRLLAISLVLCPAVMCMSGDDEDTSQEKSVLDGGEELLWAPKEDGNDAGELDESRGAAQYQRLWRVGTASAVRVSFAPFSRQRAEALTLFRLSLKCVSISFSQDSFVPQVRSAS